MPDESPETGIPAQRPDAGSMARANCDLKVNLMPQPPVPVFVLGNGRSGTTVTAALLNQLPGVHIAKETGFLATSLGMLKAIDQPSTLRRLLNHVNPWLELNAWEHRADERGYRAFCEQSGCTEPEAFLQYVWSLDCPQPWNELRFLGDNTPFYVLCIPEILQLLPNARFVHMLRDPRDVVCSMLKMRFGADDPLVAAMEWQLVFGTWLMAERLLAADQRTEVRYEDLCTSPDQTFARLAAFLGYSEAEANEALQHHSGGSTRGRSGFEQVSRMSHHTRINEPLSPTRVGRFRKELSPRQIRAVEEMTQTGMAACGYTFEEWHIHPLIHEDRARILRSQLKDFARRCLKRLMGR